MAGAIRANIDWK